MQIKVITQTHNCPNTGLSDKIRPASTKWIATTVLDWVRRDQTIGPSGLRRKLQEKFNVVIPYHRVFDGKEMALDLIQGKWNDSFHLFYSFKAKVEKASPGSVVDIDYELVRGKLKVSRGKKYQMADKKCFRRCFVCLKACWKGFLEGCRPYLAVGSTSLIGKFRGQVATTTDVNVHNWMVPAKASWSDRSPSGLGHTH